MQNLPKEHKFGKALERSDDMVNIIRNSYGEDLKKCTIESLRSSLMPHRLPR